MEKKDFLIDRAECVKFFVNRPEREPEILSVGYNNFRYVKPQFFPRRQDHCTLHFVLSGKGTLNIEKNTYSVREKQAFFLDDSVNFSYYPVKEAPWEYVWFDFTGKIAREYAGQAGFSADCPVKDCKDTQKLFTFFRVFFEKAANLRPVSYFAAAELFYALWDSVSAEQEETGFFYHSDFIEEIKRFIDLKYLNDDFTVAYLSEAMHVSHSYLCKIFREKVGTPVVAYLNEKRMSRAENLLTNTDLSVREIAFMSGFRDYEYFLKCFKKRHNVTASAFRRQKRY